ncbi:MAG: PDGLE domain-containing protein, partial [Thermoflexales bacterium]
LAASGTTSANIAVPTMGGVHMLIGIGEGLITVGALSVIYAARRDLVTGDAPAKTGSRGLVVGGILIAALLAIASPLASAFPDGLERVAEQQGFLGRAQGPAFQIFPDYVVPGIQNEAMATIAAGLLGVLIVLGAAMTLAWSRRKRAARSA